MAKAISATRTATKRLKQALIAREIASKIHDEARIWKIGARSEDDRLWELETKTKLDDAIAEVSAAEAEVRRAMLAKS
ncbi:hypothetical protein F9K96_01085 [Brucella anthropi]|uniref:hypothetical protein n=1 Tax=Brucella anthropi TaxID=529 RepID=UPI00124D0D0E|nr:hypothetical protein [Brucella anthropi]KAB2793798.1 hypothetical protein F9K96_01085 [Brucella anthropi]